jgi:hypothetical protein
MGHADALRRLVPFVVVGEDGVGADGSEDSLAGDGGLVYALEQLFDYAAEIAPAAGEKTGGVGVAVERGPVRQLVFAGNPGRAAPMEEFVLDGVAIRMSADFALAGVA